MSTASLFLLAAIKAASLQTLAISAPANPGVCAANFFGSISSEVLIGSRCTLNMASLPTISGLSMLICRSNLPALNRAESNTSGRLVAPKTITPESVPKPSISTNRELSVFSLSSFEPGIWPLPRERPMASISSINMIQGAFSLACLNKSLTLAAPTPTNISTKSDPDSVKNGTPASPATAFANKVLPVPGGPINKAPLGILPPSLVNLPGFFRNSTISSTSSLASSKPATLSKVILTLFSASNSWAFDLPTLNIWPTRPLGTDILLIIIQKRKNIRIRKPKLEIQLPQLSSFLAEYPILSSSGNFCSNSVYLSMKLSTEATLIL